MEKYLEDEKSLIKKAKKDPETFGVLYDYYYTKIFRFILHRTGNMEVAKDLTSETFFQALKNLWRFRFIARPFSAWLYKIASTQVALYFRERKKYFSVSFEHYPSLVEPRYAKTESMDERNIQIDALLNFQKIHACIRSLGETEQNVIVLRYFEDKSIKQISQILKIKINTVKSHIRRGLLRLRGMYEYNNPRNYADARRQLRGDQEVFEKK